MPLQRKIRMDPSPGPTLQTPASELPTRFHPVGTRVGAILSINMTGLTVEFFGYGTLLEDFVPPPDGLGHSKKLHAAGIKVPAITLDYDGRDHSGAIVYATECQWADEATVRDLLQHYEVTIVNIYTERENNTRDSDPPLPSP